MNTLNIAIESAKLLCEDLQRTLEHDDRVVLNPVYINKISEQLTAAKSLQQKLERCELLMSSLGVEFCAWCADPKNPSPVSHPDRQVEHSPTARAVLT